MPFNSCKCVEVGPPLHTHSETVYIPARAGYQLHLVKASMVIMVNYFNGPNLDISVKVINCCSLR